VPVENNQLYKDRKGGRVGHMEKLIVRGEADIVEMG
jgi:hypothetical protein